VRAVLVLLVTIASGCVARDEGPPPLARTGDRWADCYRHFQPEGDATSDLERLGQVCAAPMGLSFLTSFEGAEQRARGAPEQLRLRARRGCYRAFAIGGPGVSDLDVAVYDPRGNLVAADVSRDAWPVVPPRGPLCVNEDGTLTVSVSVARGAGGYLLAIWGPAPPAPTE
jgi:hypothetical protein